MLKLSEYLDLGLEYHEDLNPKLWEAPGVQLKSDIRNKLIAFAYAWAEFAKIPKECIKDIIIAGGNCNYNYTSNSDIDVHLLIDKSFFGNSVFIDDYLWDKKALWLSGHDVKVAGYSVEPFALGYGSESYPKDQGVYSLLKNVWVSKPAHKNFDFSKDVTLNKKVEFYVELIDRMITNREPINKFKTLSDKFYNMRSAGLQKNGEFSFENLVFKALRNVGALDKMNKYVKSQQDNDLSY